MNEPVKLVPTKPDAELAEELRNELAVAAVEWMKACTKANKAGFQVQANFGPNAFGEHVIQALSLIKIY